MTRLRTVLSRLRALFQAGQLDRDLDDEIAGHLSEATEEAASLGLYGVLAYNVERRT